MKTAILISGEARTFSTCWPLQSWQVFRHYPNLEFFVTVKREPAAAAFDVLTRDYEPGMVHIEQLDDPVLEVTPAMATASRFAPYANAAPDAKLLLQHWSNRQVWGNFERNGRGEYSTIIRMRADNWMHSFTPPVPPLASQCIVPRWAGFGSGVNDRLAVMGPRAAAAYFRTFDNIEELLARGCPFHPETLVGASVELEGCTIDRSLQTVFTTLRAPGDARPHRPAEIHVWDLLSAAENRNAA